MPPASRPRAYREMDRLLRLQTLASPANLGRFLQNILHEAILTSSLHLVRTHHSCPCICLILAEVDAFNSLTEP